MFGKNLYSIFNILRQAWVLDLVKEGVKQGILVAILSRLANRFMEKVQNRRTVNSIIQMHLQEAKIDLVRDYVFEKNDTELKELAEQIIANNRQQTSVDTVLLCGSSGMGKTFFIRWLASKCPGSRMYDVSRIAYSYGTYGEKGLSAKNALQEIVNHATTNNQTDITNIIFIDEFDIMCESKEFVHQFFINFGTAATNENNTILFAAINRKPEELDEKIRQRFQKVIAIDNSLEKTVGCFQTYIKLYHDVEISKYQIETTLRRYTVLVEECFARASDLMQHIEPIVTPDGIDIERQKSYQSKKLEMKKLSQLNVKIQDATAFVQKTFAELFDVTDKTIIIPPRLVVMLTKDATALHNFLPSFDEFDKVIFCGKIQEIQTESAQSTAIFKRAQKNKEL